MTLRITIGQRGGGAKEPLEFTADSVPFGRSQDNLLVIPDQEKQVSSSHGRLELRGGTWFVEDLESTNGTLLNDRTVEPGRALPLADGDRIGVGDFEITVHIDQALGEAEQTMVRFDARGVAGRLADRLAALFAEALDASSESRAAVLRGEIERSIDGLMPEQSRAVVAEVARRFAQQDAGSEDATPTDQSEELYQAGYRVLDDLARRFLGGDKFASAEDVARFGRLVMQTLEANMEWISKCMQGRQEFETQFGANITMLFSLGGNPLKAGKSPDEIGAYLLDWRGERQPSAIRESLEGAYRDLAQHQLGMLEGAREAIRAVLHRLDPAAIEEMAAGRSKGWLDILPGSGREWDYYKEAYKEITDEKGRLFDELISPGFRKGYLATHEQHFEENPPGPPESAGS